MKIASWNCNGAYRNKFHFLSGLNADIHVIQECENPKTSDVLEYKEYATNHIWYGSKRDINKGIGVFAKPEISLGELEWSNPHSSLFIPVNVNNTFILLAVWTTIDPYYIGEYIDYQNENIDRYNNDMIIIGDFNSGVKFDTKKGVNEERSHITTVKILSALGLSSAYHVTKDEKQGSESLPTFYWHRKVEFYSHIDYCYVNKDRIISFNVLGDTERSRDYWLQYSDHIPLILDIKSIS